MSAILIISADHLFRKGASDRNHFKNPGGILTAVEPPLIRWSILKIRPIGLGNWVLWRYVYWYLDTTSATAGWLWPHRVVSGAIQATPASVGWTAAVTPTDRNHLGRPLYDTFAPVGTSTWKLLVANGTHSVVIMCGDADSRAQTNHLKVNGVAINDPTPYDGLVTLGYETGSFDGYALTVNVTGGFITIQSGTGALRPKLNFIEVAPAGTTTDAATLARVQAAAVKATQDTSKPKAKTPPTVKRNMWGTYVDELVSYTFQKPRHSPIRYYTHANSLYSIAATTNAAGAVVERYSYNAYGVRTVKNSVGVTLVKSAVNQDRGFTGYKIDNESSLMYARARMYSAKVGRFVSRDEFKYQDVITINFANKLTQILSMKKAEYRDFVASTYRGNLSLYGTKSLGINAVDPTGHEEGGGNPPSPPHETPPPNITDPEVFKEWLEHLTKIIAGELPGVPPGTGFALDINNCIVAQFLSGVVIQTAIRNATASGNLDKLRAAMAIQAAAQKYIQENCQGDHSSCPRKNDDGNRYV